MGEEDGSLEGWGPGDHRSRLREGRTLSLRLRHTALGVQIRGEWEGLQLCQDEEHIKSEI